MYQPFSLLPIMALHLLNDLLGGQRRGQNRICNLRPNSFARESKQDCQKQASAPEYEHDE
jgi:hypothetical protein